MNNVLKVTQLTKHYGNVVAVDNLSFSVNPGEVVALLGPNGSGKTTTIRSAAGLLQPSSGAIRMGEFDLRRDYRRARELFAYLPQQARFAPSLTVGEVMRFHAQLRLKNASAISNALEQVSLQGVLDRPVGQLSGGMRQRLSIAVTLLTEAPLLLLDEPTANLDPEGALEFRAMAKRWRAEGRSMLLCTHVLTDVEELADRVLVLVAGKLAAEQTIGELRLRMSRYSRLRVDVGDITPAHLAAAMDGGALDARKNGHGMIITAPEQRRLNVLHSLQRVGVVQQFETEKPSLEDLYLDYVKGASDAHS